MRRAKLDEENRSSVLRKRLLTVLLPSFTGNAISIMRKTVPTTSKSSYFFLDIAHSYSKDSRSETQRDYSKHCNNPCAFCRPLLYVYSIHASVFMRSSAIYTFRLLFFIYVYIYIINGLIVKPSISIIDFLHNYVIDVNFMPEYYKNDRFFLQKKS